MSWNFVVVGDRLSVQAHLRTLDRVPECIRGAVIAAMEAVPGEETVFLIDSAGSLDRSGGTVKFSVRVKQVFSAIGKGTVVG